MMLQLKIIKKGADSSKIQLYVHLLTSSACQLIS